jgi:hypothetical protein
MTVTRPRAAFRLELCQAESASQAEDSPEDDTAKEANAAVLMATSM